MLSLACHYMNSLCYLTAALLFTAACHAADSDSAFAPAIAVAQQRTVKVFGAGIGRTAGYASGIIVGPEGQIVTALGVFLGADNLRVTLPSGKTYPAEVVRRSADLQAALLKIDAPTPEYFELSQSAEA